jgi:RsiW-degrading membrane proteinase PrsW (M82 family)
MRNEPPRTAVEADGFSPGNQSGRKLLIWMFTVLSIVGVLLALRSAVHMHDVRESTRAVSFALLPVPVAWAAYWWLDRYEPEPRRYKLAALAWGAAAAPWLAVSAEQFAHKLGVPSHAVTVGVAPVVEEIVKASFLFLTLARLRRVIDGFLDALIYAGIVGIGFAATENVLYYAASFLGADNGAGASAMTATFLIRGMISPFVHPTFTSVTGIALAMALTNPRLRTSRVRQVATTLLGLAGAISLHALWNFSDGRGPSTFAVIYLAIAAAVFGVAVFAALVRTEQVHELEDNLNDLADSGSIDLRDIPYLVTFRDRRAARDYARRNFGADAAVAVNRYQGLATEAAFLRHALDTGRHVPRGAEQLAHLEAALRSMRGNVNLPRG